MTGVGGPLLCIGDLLCDVGEDGDAIGTGSNETTNISNSSTIQQLNISDPNNLHPSHLAQLFQKNFDQLDKALAGTDHTWTALTLKLCTALETANKLVQSTNSHVDLLSEKVEKLRRIVNQRDSAIAAAKAIQGSTRQNNVVSGENSLTRSPT